MIFFLYGPDSYRLKQAVAQTRKDWDQKNPGNLSYFYFDFQEKNTSELLQKLDDSLKTNSLFDTSRLILIKNIFEHKLSPSKITEAIRQRNLQKSQDTTVIIAEVGDDKALSKKDKESFLFFSGKGNEVKTFEALTPAKLENWARDHIQEIGAQAETAAIKRLVQITGTDTWSLAQETNKLANYCGSRTISISDVDLLINSHKEVGVFELSDAVASRNKARALEILYKELKAGREAYGILGTITYQFRNLLMIKDLASRKLSPDAIAKKAAIHPFVAKKSYGYVQKYELEQLKKSYLKLLELDTQAKTGQVNLTDELFRFILA
jgi:DNA polymerase III subunit delta